MNKVVPLIKRKILDNSLDYAKDKMVANKYVAYLTAFNNSDLFSNTAILKNIQLYPLMVVNLKHMKEL